MPDDDLPMPQDETLYLLVKWNEHGVFVDTRGTSLPEAYTILSMAVEAVWDRLDDAFVIADDEDADLVADGLLAIEDDDD